MKKKGIISGSIGFVFIFMFLYTFNTYTSSPGFTTQEYAQEFFKNTPTCYGYSFLMNREATYSDSLGKSLCLGILKSK